MCVLKTFQLVGGLLQSNLSTFKQKMSLAGRWRSEKDLLEPVRQLFSQPFRYLVQHLPFGDWFSQNRLSPRLLMFFLGFSVAVFGFLRSFCLSINQLATSWNKFQSPAELLQKFAWFAHGRAKKPDNYSLQVWKQKKLKSRCVKLVIRKIILWLNIQKGNRNLNSIWQSVVSFSIWPIDATFSTRDIEVTHTEKKREKMLLPCFLR